MNDEITKIMEQAFSEAQSGAANYSRIGEEERFWVDDGWRGCYTCDCGEWSTSHDYLLKNGMITNSLCVFYLQYYRNSIPESEIKKVMELVEFYIKP